MSPTRTEPGRTIRRLFAVLVLVSLYWLIDGRDAFAVSGSSVTVCGGSARVLDYSKFSHSNPQEHADLMARSNCESCHRRNDSSLAPRFPVHKDCTGCHLIQFTSSDSSSAVNLICVICHTSQSLDSTNPPTRSFPALRSFVAEFDHAQHLQGKESARPSAGCTACHNSTRRGVGQSIPARLGAHQTCYQCHSAGKQASSLSACGICHALGRYSPTTTNARAFRAGFSHVDHGARVRLTCTSCHNVRAQGLPQAKQVGFISPTQHFSSARAQTCTTCHNGRRAFGDTNTHDCKRCHKRDGFRF